MVRDRKGSEYDWDTLRLYFRRHHHHEPSNLEMALLWILLRLGKACPGVDCSHITGSNQHLKSHMNSQGHGTELPSKSVNSEKIMAAAFILAGQVSPAHTTATTAQPVAAGPHRLGLGQAFGWDAATAAAAAGPAAGAPTTYTESAAFPPTTRAGVEPLGNLNRQQTFQGRLQHDLPGLEDHFLVLETLDSHGWVTELGGYDNQADATTAFPGSQQYDTHDGTAGAPFADIADTGEGPQRTSAMPPSMNNLDCFPSHPMPGPSQQGTQF